jgi:Helix-turn-helix domain
VTASINDELESLRRGERERMATAARLVTLQQFCAITSLAESTARQWIKTGRLRAVSGNAHHLRIPISEVDRVFRPKLHAVQGD